MNNEASEFKKWFESQGYDMSHWHVAALAWIAGAEYMIKLYQTTTTKDKDTIENG